MSYYQADCCPVDGYCEALTRGIEMVNGINNTSFKATPVGTLQLLFDPENRADAEYILQDEGAVRKIRVKRLQRSTEADAKEGILCLDAEQMPYVEQCITVNKGVTIGFESTLEEMQGYCAAYSRAASGDFSSLPLMTAHLQKIMSQMNGIREKINSMVIAEILANVGVNVSTGSNGPVTLDMLDATTGGKVEKGIQILNHQMVENEVYGTYLISGFGIFDRFNTSMQYGCCNQWGLNWDAMNSAAPYKYYKDLKLKDLTGNPDLFLVFAPGAVQFVYYNDVLLHNREGRRHGNTLYGVVIDPLVPGLRYDVAIEETNCNGYFRQPKWTINMYLNFDVVFIPENAFRPGKDRLFPTAGMSNGVFQYIAAEV